MVYGISSSGAAPQAIYPEKTSQTLSIATFAVDEQVVINLFFVAELANCRYFSVSYSLRTPEKSNMMQWRC